MYLFWFQDPFLMLVHPKLLSKYKLILRDRYHIHVMHIIILFLTLELTLALPISAIPRHSLLCCPPESLLGRISFFSESFNLESKV